MLLFSAAWQKRLPAAARDWQSSRRSSFPLVIALTSVAFPTAACVAERGGPRHTLLRRCSVLSSVFWELPRRLGGASRYQFGSLHPGFCTGLSACPWYSSRQ